MTCSRTSKPGLVHRVTARVTPAQSSTAVVDGKPIDLSWARHKCAAPQHTEVYCAQTVQAVFRAVPKAAEATDSNESAMLWVHTTAPRRRMDSSKPESGSPPCWPPTPTHLRKTARRTDAHPWTVRQRNLKVSLSSRWDHPRAIPRTIAAFMSNQTLKGARSACLLVPTRKAPSRRAASPRQHEADGRGQRARAHCHSYLGCSRPLRRIVSFVYRASPPHRPKPVNPLPYCARLRAFECFAAQHRSRATGRSPPKRQPPCLESGHHPQHPCFTLSTKDPSTTLGLYHSEKQSVAVTLSKPRCCLRKRSQP